MTAEDRPVRERLAEALAQQCGRCGGRGRESHQISRDPDDGTEDWPCPSCRGAGVTTKHVAPAELADAILSDADLLDDLCRERLEQVGWWYEDDTPGRECHHSDREDCWKSTHKNVVPVFIFRGRTDG